MDVSAVFFAVQTKRSCWNCMDRAMEIGRTILFLGGKQHYFTKNVVASGSAQCADWMKGEKEDENSVYCKIRCGEVWHEFVLIAIRN